MDKEALLIKVLEMLLNGNTSVPSNNITSSLIGEYVIIRSRSEGINAGYLVEADETGCVLRDSRRLWYHKPKNNESWYEGVALYGLSDDSKISVAVDRKIIIEDYSITKCTEEARLSIQGAKANEG